MTEPCPHCRTTVRHTDRVGCCSGCGRLFSSMSAFDKHRRVTYCVDPATVGLVARPAKSDPRVLLWGWPMTVRPEQWVGTP